MLNAAGRGSHGSTGAGGVLGLGLLGVIVLVASGCSTMSERDGMPVAPPDVSKTPDAVPKAEPRSPYGNPDSYVVDGRRYHTLGSARDYVERGIASWYGTKFHGRRTSSGEPYDMYAMTAAHRTLPLPSYVEVTDLENGRHVVVRVNDRGPFRPNRLIDLSYAAARKLGIIGAGTAPVEVRAIDPSAPGSRYARGTPLAAPAPRTATAVVAAGTEAVAPAPATGAAKVALYLQVGAFRFLRNAERLKDRVYSLADAMVRIQEAVSGGRRVYRVQLGPLSDVEQVDRLAARLAGKGLDDTRVVVE